MRRWRGQRNFLLQEQDRGYSLPEEHVCADCLNDEYLRDYAEANVSVKVCDFCGNEADENIAAPLARLLGLVFEAIHFEWNDPDNEGIVYETAEGGYQADMTNTQEILRDMKITDDEKLLQLINKNIHNDYWVERDFYAGSNSQRFTWGWEAFCDEVMHRKRYLFLHADPDENDWEITPSNFLFKLADYKNTTLDDVGLIREVNTDKDIYRVRIGSQNYTTAAELGAPPAQYAIQPNRMSPAGIPMFYDSFEPETDILETYSPRPKDKVILSIGRFHPLKPLRFLDLSRLPAIPSIFDRDRHDLIHAF
jgi:hypothetical protein